MTPGRMTVDVDRPGGARPLAVTGIIAAAWCVGIGLAVLTTVTLIGWIAAPRTALGAGLPGVFRTAVDFWLVAHHAGFSLPDGRVGMLPLGLTLLPGALLYRGGGWLIRAAEIRGRKRVGVLHVAVALAVPYAALAGVLALVARSPVVMPSVWQSVLAGLLLAIVAGGLGAARALVAASGTRVRSGLGALLRLLPDRPRSLVVGVAGSTAMLIASGAVLVGAALAADLSAAREVYGTLAPGIVGGLLLFLVELAFLPNAVIWGMSYAIGPGFSVGAETSVSPAGVFLNAVPAFPPFAALPEPGPAPLLSLVAMAAPFLAGAVGGVLTVRAMPSPVYEAAPLWGFVSGALTGCVAAVLAALSGGPLGGGRLVTMGPSAWQVGLLATLEVGVSAAVAAWAANWALL
ncbi:MAG: cell division protein PerM, partial [Actinomadura sp.]